MRTKIAVAGITALALLGGGAAGLVLTTPGLAGAQDAGVAVASGSTTAGTGQTDPGLPSEFADAIAKLVTDGTLTQAQADAVTTALAAAHPARGDRGGRGGKHLDAAATALGMTADELRTALDGGQTVAQVAASKGVGIDKVVTAIVDAIKLDLAQKVTAGSLTQAEADARLADATSHATDFVNGVRPARGDGGPRGGHGPGGVDATNPSTPA